VGNANAALADSAKNTDSITGERPRTKLVFVVFGISSLDSFENHNRSRERKASPM